MRRILALAAVALLAGACGPKGPAGPVGPPGEQGPPGTAGITTYAARFNSEAEIDSWYVSSNGTVTFEEGRMVMEGTSEDYFAEVKPQRQFSRQGQMLDLRVTVERLSEGSVAGAWGLQLHDLDGLGYGFLVDLEWIYFGKWIVSQDRPEYVPILPPRRAAELSSAGPHRLQILWEDGSFRLFLNDTEVGVATDRTYTSGRVGLLVGYGERIAFDDLVATEYEIEPLLKPAASLPEVGREAGQDFAAAAEPAYLKLATVW